MNLVAIILIFLGLVFLIFGSLIYFKGQYSLINRFEKDYREGKKDENYAKKVGLIEFIIGLVFFIIGIILFVI